MRRTYSSPSRARDRQRPDPASSERLGADRVGRSAEEHDFCKELAGAEDVNQLPLDFDVAWYEQKAVCVLMALLALGFKGVRIGPTLPAFVSEGVKKLVVETFGLKATSSVEEDLAAIMG